PPVPRAIARPATMTVLDEIARQFPDVTRDDVARGVAMLLQARDYATLEAELANVGHELVMHVATDRELRARLHELMQRDGARAPGADPADAARARLGNIASPRLLRR